MKRPHCHLRLIPRRRCRPFYTGNASYPAILSAEEYRRAASAKPATGTPTDTSGQAKTVRQLSRCAVCGGTLTLSANKHGWARWNCPSCGGISADAVMPDTIGVLTHIVSAIRNDRNMVQAPSHQENHTQGLLDQSEKDFDSAIHTEAFDESTARAKAVSLAAARFNALGSEDYETVRIQYILSATEQSGGLDTALLRQITSAILIYPNGEVRMKLKNGQIIKGSDRT